MSHSKIIGTGACVPEKVLTNNDLEKFLDTSDEWISTRTGIKERRVAVSESTVDLSEGAAIRAIKAAGLTHADIDLIIVGTVTPDMSFPSTACFLQERIGVRPSVPAFDVSAACSGFLFALDTADKYIVTGAAEKVLVVGVDIFSRIVDWKDRATCVLFGDGAGAVVLSKSSVKGEGILSSNIHSDGSLWRSLFAPGAAHPSPFEVSSGEDAKNPYVQMHGGETFKLAVKTIVAACNEALEAAGLKSEDISILIPHQANERIITAVAKRLGLTDSQVCINIDKYGNTSAGSIPIALDEVVRGGRVSSGDILLFVAFGGGLTWASTLVKW